MLSHHRLVLAVALVVLWCALSCVIAIAVGRAVYVADADARADADFLFLDTDEAHHIDAVDG